MNWEDIGAIGEILGATAVFASLIYLALQIKSSTRQFRDQIEDEIQTRSFQAYDPIYEGQNAKIMRMGLYDHENLDDTKKFVFNLWLHRQMAVLYSMARRVKSGHLENEVLDGYIQHYKYTIFDTPGGKTWLEKNLQYLLSDPSNSAILPLLRRDA